MGRAVPQSKTSLSPPDGSVLLQVGVLLSALSFGLSQILVRKNLDKSNFVYISLTVIIILGD